jgi:hypothetical protein
MNALLILLILLLALFICCFLGGKYFQEGFSDTSNPTIFIGPNGDTASIVMNSNGTQTINARIQGQSLTYKQTTPTSPIYMSTNNNGMQARVSGNNMTIEVSQGQNVVLTAPSSSSQTNTNSSNYDNYNHYTGTSDTLTNTQYYGSTGYQIPPFDSQAYNPSSFYSSQNDSTYGTSVNNSNSQYNSSLPQGIPASKIPPGQENLYILKSQIVPPVCPVCPAPSASYSKKSKCAPCPACERCPEPSMICKAVPNYNAISQDKLPTAMLNGFSNINNQGNLPMPVLNDFSSF